MFQPLTIKCTLKFQSTDLIKRTFTGMWKVFIKNEVFKFYEKNYLLWYSLKLC